MDQITIQELVSTVLAELKRLGYKQTSIRKYKKTYEDIIQYANKQNVKVYSIEFGEQYLRKVRKINLLYIASGNDNLYNKKHYLPVRACQCLVEWQLHKYLPLKRLGKLASQNIPVQFKECYESHIALCKEAGYSKRGVYVRLNHIKRMLIFFNDKGIHDINKLTTEDISAFFKTQIELESGTVVTVLASIRVFFRHLYQTGLSQEDYTAKLPSFKANKNFKLPQTWQKEDVKVLLNSIDCRNDIGKRDYAILMLITRYGLRQADVKDLKLSNLRWDTNTIEIVQSKTGSPLHLPLIKDVGWAIIDYLKYGRPVSDYPNVFLTSTIPYRPFGIHSCGLNSVLRKHIRNSGLKIRDKIPKGLHSLRHTLASTMLAKDVPLPVISSVLGHATQKATSGYLHIDIKRLKECALNPEEVLNNDNN